MKKKSKTNLLQPIEPRAWQLAQLAASLHINEIRTQYSSLGDKFDEFGRKLKLDRAIADAQYLLLSAESETRIVHAYQIFPKGSIFIGIDKMKRQFATFGWRGLTSWSSCENLLEEILKSERQKEEQIEKRKALISGRVPCAGMPLSDDEQIREAWKRPESLVAGPKGKKKYDVRSILLIAHFFFREQFRNRIEMIQTDVEG